MGKVIGKRDCSAYWSDGWNHTNVDANAVLNEMSVLDEGFTAEDLVNLASDSSKELHKCFTWDDGKAAVLWRKQEARNLCCHLKIQYIESDKPSSEPRKLEVRHYVKPDNKVGYQSITKVVNNVDKRQEYIDKFTSELKSITLRYAMLSADFPELFSAINEL